MHLVVFKKGLIFFKISVSVVDVLLNPGVSMRITVFPSRVNSSESWTSVVHNSESVATGRFEPLARLTNWRQPGELLIVITKHYPLTDDFPLPVAPMTLVTVGMRF